VSLTVYLVPRESGAEQRGRTATGIGSLPGVWRHARQPDQPPPANGKNTGEQSEGSNGESDARALEAVQAAEAHWSSIMKTLRGPQARLRELAAAAQSTAAALRQSSTAGLERSHPAREIPANWQPPLELRQGTPRPGPLAPWQALDRAFKALVARSTIPPFPCQISLSRGMLWPERQSRWPTRSTTQASKTALSARSAPSPRARCAG